MRSLRLAAAVEERLLVPTYGSRWPFAPIAAHRGLSLPLQLTGMLRTGTVRHNGAPIRVATVGREKLATPIVGRLFGRWGEPALAARRGLWSPRTLAEIDADLIVAEVHRWMAPRFRRAGWIVVPDAVRWTGELSNVPGPNPPRSLREDLRKVRQAGFKLTQSTSATDWELFATRMAAPQALARFGDQAWVPSDRLLEELRRVGTLHLVHLDGMAVAGVCSVSHGSTLWLPLLGVLDGDPALFRRGASLAALALPIEWARQRGFQRLDLGRTSPFVHDGIHRVKRKWGLRPTIDPLAHVAAVRVGEAARAAFAGEPLLIETNIGLATYGGVPR